MSGTQAGNAEERFTLIVSFSRKRTGRWRPWIGRRIDRPAYSLDVIFEE
jgi:hypothetical protein